MYILVTTAWRVLRLRMEELPPAWSVFFSMARQPLGVLGRLIFRGFTITLFFRHTTFCRTPLDE
jgi:hypothetical protein